MERLTYRDKDGMAMMKERGGWKSGGIDRLAAYEDTGLEPEQVLELKSFTQGGIHKVDDGWKHAQELLRAEQDGLFIKLPFVAMIEQSLQDGKMAPQRDQRFNGRYAVVYSDHKKWKSPLIDICGKPYLREEAEARMAVLAQKGGTHEDSGSL